MQKLFCDYDKMQPHSPICIINSVALVTFKCTLKNIATHSLDTFFMIMISAELSLNYIIFHQFLKTNNYAWFTYREPS